MLKFIKSLSNRIAQQQQNIQQNATTPEIDIHITNPAIRRHFLKIVENNGMLLEAFHPVVRKDREIVATAVMNAPEALNFASNELRADAEFLVSVVSIRGEALAYVHPSKQRDPHVVWHAVRQNGLALQHAHHSLRKDIRIALHALKSHPEAIHYVSPCLKSNRAFIKWALETNGHTLRHIEEIFKSDPELMKLALASAPETLDHMDISPEKETDHLLVIECINTHGTHFLKTHPQFLQHRTIALAALKHNGLLLSYMSADFKRDAELVLCAVKQNGWALVYAHVDFLADKNVVEAAVRNDPTVLSIVHKDLRTNKKIIIIAVAQRGVEIRHAHEELKKDKQVALLAIRQDPEAFHHLHPSLKTSRDFLREALSINKQIASFIADIADPEVRAMIKGAHLQLKGETEDAEKSVLGADDTMEDETHVTKLIEEHVEEKDEPAPGGVIEEIVHIELEENHGAEVRSTMKEEKMVKQKAASPPAPPTRTSSVKTETESITSKAKVASTVHTTTETKKVTKKPPVISKQKPEPPKRFSLMSHITTDTFVSAIDDVSSPAEKPVTRPLPKPRISLAATSTTAKTDARAASLAALIKKHPPAPPKRQSSRQSGLVIEQVQKQVSIVEEQKQQAAPERRQLPAPKPIEVEQSEPEVEPERAVEVAAAPIAVGKPDASRIDRSTLHLRLKLTKEHRHAHSTNRIPLIQRRLGEKNVPKVTVKTRNSPSSSGRQRTQKKADSAVPLKSKSSLVNKTITKEREAPARKISPSPMAQSSASEASSVSLHVVSPPNSVEAL